jgi:hypothetical protein
VRAVYWLAKPTVQTAFNGAMTLVWLVMLPITLIFVGTFSAILWVSFISAWALFATHLGAWIAALVNVKAERIDNRTETSRHFQMIEESEQRLMLKLEESEHATLARMEAQHKQMSTSIGQVIDMLIAEPKPPPLPPGAIQRG